jgi:hypothetical protein
MRKWWSWPNLSLGRSDIFWTSNFPLSFLQRTDLKITDDTARLAPNDTAPLAPNTRTPLSLRRHKVNPRPWRATS